MQIKIHDIEWKTGKVKGFLAKELLNLENGSLKLISAEPGNSYPMHTHPDKTEFAYVLEGNPQFKIGSSTYESSPGDCFIFPQKEHHAIINHTGGNCLMLIGAIKSV